MTRALLAFALLTGLASACSSSDHGNEPPYARETLLKPTTCNECHQEHYQEWSVSMHAYSSSDPLFLAMNRRGQEETNGTLKNFCVNCHAPMATQELGDDTTIDPATLPAELQGVTCYFCHNVKDIPKSHANNPLVVAGDTTMRGGIKNPIPFRAHGSTYSPLHDREKLQSASLCGTCHDIVVPGHFAGATTDAGAPTDVPLERTFAEWQTSNFAVPGPSQLACGKCHMPEVRGPIASPPPPHPTMFERDRHLHDFPAVDTAFSNPNFYGTEQQRSIQERKIQNGLNLELRVQICVNQTVGDILVNLENVNAGHNFPSGASQDRRLWVELHAWDSSDSSDRRAGHYYESGVVQPGESAIAVSEATVNNGGIFRVLRDVTTKTDGTPAHMFWDVAKVKPDTIRAPLAGDLTFLSNIYGIRYNAFTVTKVLRPLHVTAKVWLEPVGLDVIDDLLKSGHLENDLGDAGSSIRNSMPRHALLPKQLASPDAGADELVTLDWTFEEASKQPGGESLCLETSPRRPR